MHLHIYQVVSAGVFVWFLMAWVESVVYLGITLNSNQMVRHKVILKSSYIYSILVVVSFTVFLSGFIK